MPERVIPAQVHPVLEFEFHPDSEICNSTGLGTKCIHLPRTNTGKEFRKTICPQNEKKVY